MLVDPPTPVVEVLGTALIGDLSHRSGFDPVVHRDRDETNLARLRVLVAQSDATTGLADRTIIETTEDVDDTATGGVSAESRLFYKLRLFLCLVRDLVVVDPDLPQECLLVFDQLAGLAGVERDRLIGHFERLLTSLTAGGDAHNLPTR